jgi:hypothetical protein
VRHMARARAMAVQMGNEFLDLVHGKGLDHTRRYP